MVIDRTEEELTIQHEVFEVLRKKIESAKVNTSQLRQLFEEFDSDHDGHLTEAEFRNAMHSIGIHLNGQKWKRLFDAVDTDSSGSIEFKEFFACVYPGGDGKGAQAGGVNVERDVQLISEKKN